MIPRARNNVRYDPEQVTRANAESLTLYTIDVRGPLVGGGITAQGYLFTGEEFDEVLALLTRLSTRKREAKE